MFNIVPWSIVIETPDSAIVETKEAFDKIKKEQFEAGYLKGVEDCKAVITDILRMYRYSDEEVLEKIIDYVGG